MKNELLELNVTAIIKVEVTPGTRDIEYLLSIARSKYENRDIEIVDIHVDCIIPVPRAINHND